MLQDFFGSSSSKDEIVPAEAEDLHNSDRRVVERPLSSKEIDRVKNKTPLNLYLTDEYLKNAVELPSLLNSKEYFLQPQRYLLESIPIDETFPENPAGNAPETEKQMLEGNSYEEESFLIDECHLIYEGENEVSYMVPTPKGGTPRNRSLTPITIAMVKTIGTLKSRVLLKCLLDTGSSTTMIHRRALPSKIMPVPLQRTKTVNTLAGEMTAEHMVILRDIRLPEFDKNRRIAETRALVFDKECRYDIIFGADFLTRIGVKFNFDEGTMEWFENILQMREPWDMKNEEFLAMADSAQVQTELEDEYGDEFLENYLAAPILDAKYERTTIQEVISEQKHLNDEQKRKLKRVLDKHSKLFYCTLGVYPHQKFSIELDPDAKPVHARPYSVPKIHLEVFKKELQHLVKLHVLSPQGISKRASSTFILP